MGCGRADVRGEGVCKRGGDGDVGRGVRGVWVVRGERVRVCGVCGGELDDGGVCGGVHRLHGKARSV